MAEAVAAPNSGESGQRPIVELRLAVREGDESLVLGAVMPAQSPSAARWRKESSHHVEDGLHIGRPRRCAKCLLFGFFVILATPRRGEKASRRQLVGVAGDNGPVGAHECPDGVSWGDLGCLVEDHNIEAL